VDLGRSASRCWYVTSVAPMTNTHRTRALRGVEIGSGATSMPETFAASRSGMVTESAAGQAIAAAYHNRTLISKERRGCESVHELGPQVEGKRCYHNKGADKVRS